MANKTVSITSISDAQKKYDMFIYYIAKHRRKQQKTARWRGFLHLGDLSFSQEVLSLWISLEMLFIVEVDQDRILGN